MFFDIGDPRGPCAKGVGHIGEGQTAIFAQRRQVECGRGLVGLWAGEDSVDLTGYSAFEASHDFSFRFSFLDASGDIFSGAFIAFHSHQHDAVQGSIPASLATRLSR